MQVIILYKSGSMEEINTTMMTLDSPGDGALLEDNFIDLTDVDEGIYLERRYAPLESDEETHAETKEIDTRLNSRVLIVPQDSLEFVVAVVANGHLLLKQPDLEKGEEAEYGCGLMRA